MVTLTGDMDPAGQFRGQWIRIESLDDPVPDYALQMAELEVFGSIQERPRLTVHRSAARITLTWKDGALQSADRVTRPWNSVSGASSPFPVQATAAAKFYRLRK